MCPLQGISILVPYANECKLYDPRHLIFFWDFSMQIGVCSRLNLKNATTCFFLLFFFIFQFFFEFYMQICIYNACHKTL